MAFLWHDLRDAARALARSRGYSLVVVLTLGLGIGVNTAIFTIVDALLFKPLPYPDGERIVRVAEWPRTGGDPWLFETRTGDPAVIAGAAVLFGAVALLAGWLPARRASNVDPLTLLRQD